MALLRSLRTDELVPLPAPCRIGSVADADLRIARPHVSALHATIDWRGGAWCLHDQGSRNGTTLDGRRLAPGEYAPLSVGQVIAFGDPAEAWRVEDVGAPGLFARRDDGVIRHAVDHLLALPDDAEPEVTVFLARGTWYLEEHGERYEFTGRGHVRAGGRSWRLFCPMSQSDTSPAPPGSILLRRLTLRLEVNDDETLLQLTWVHAGGEIAIGSRTYNPLLLALADERERDLAGGAGPDDAGWIKREVLLGELGLASPNPVDLHVFNVRRELGRHLVLHAGDVIERRQFLVEEPGGGPPRREPRLRLAPAVGVDVRRPPSTRAPASNDGR